MTLLIGMEAILTDTWFISFQSDKRNDLWCYQRIFISFSGNKSIVFQKSFLSLNEGGVLLL